MKSIKTLVADIYDLFRDTEHTVKEENALDFGHKMGQMVQERLGENNYKPRLRLSNLGTPCKRKLWYSINTPEDGEKLTPATRIKFMFGDILELFLLFLAKEAGHKVEGEQDTVEINGVEGHRDAIIDGTLIDVKSASTYSFAKFDQGLQEQDDAFGYLTQLGTYLDASCNDPLLVEKDEAGFLVIDKQHGKITLDMHPKDSVNYNSKVDEVRSILEKDQPPSRQYSDEPVGKSGNRKLGVVCSYCSFKHKCWPGLRTFLYSNRPEFLTEVHREPKVPEVT